MRWLQAERRRPRGNRHSERLGELRRAGLTGGCKRACRGRQMRLGFGRNQIGQGWPGRGLPRQAHHEKPVHATDIRPIVRPQAQGTLGCQPCRIDPRKIGRYHLQPWMARQGGCKLRLALVWQQRAGRVHQPPAGVQPAKGAVDELGLQRDQAGDLGAILGKGQVGVPPDRARGRAGRIQKDCVEPSVRLPMPATTAVAPAA